jgi:hypothetical protein
MVTGVMQISTAYCTYYNALDVPKISQSVVAHCGGLALIQGHSMWDLWLTQQQLTSTPGFSHHLSCNQYPILIHQLSMSSTKHTLATTASKETVLTHAKNLKKASI